MAAIPVRSFATLVGNFAAGVQGRASALIDFSVGSVLRAVAEATSDLTLWLQSLVVYVLTLTRAATSRDDDLDSWYADWNFYRLPTKAALGIVTFGRLSADGRGVVGVGAQVQTEDGSLIYAVTADPTHPAWSAGDNGYVLTADVTSLDLAVQAILPAGTKNGSAWNVGAGQITAMRSTIVGVDLVTNGAPFTTGIDAESDPDFRARFPLYIAGLSKATPAAIRSAIAGLQQGLTCSIEDRPGRITVVVDDGTGAPSAATVAAAMAAVNAVRAGGVWAAVIGASRLAADVTMVVTVATSYDRAAIQARVTQALGVYINGLGLGVRLPYTALAGIAYAVPGVTNVTGVVLNGGTADLVPGYGRTVKAGMLTVSPGV